MKKRLERKKVIFLLFILIFLSISFKSSPIKNTDTQETIIENVNTSQNWILKPTIIDDSGVGGNGTWAWAVAQDWCRGSGTSGDPYIIENITINGKNIKNCLEIRDSNAYIIVNNSVFYDSGYSLTKYYSGILLNNTYNTIIKKNNISDNKGNGIYVLGGGNNKITNNIMERNRDMGRFGIMFSQTTGNNASNNYLSNNGMYGIGISESSDNIILNNTIEQSDISGIEVGSNSNNNTLIDNFLTQNGQYGIAITGTSHGNIIKSNDIWSSPIRGILVSGLCYWNKAYLNVLMSNGQNAVSEINNKWDNGSIGNSWDDYTGFDMNNNGIGDSPYNISLVPLIQDRFPIYKDIWPPELTILSPKSQLKTKKPPEIQVEITDKHPITSRWYIVNNKYNLTFIGNSFKIDSSVWKGLKSEEPIKVDIYARDLAGNIGHVSTSDIIKGSDSESDNNGNSNSDINLVNIFIIGGIAISITAVAVIIYRMKKHSMT